MIWRRCRTKNMADSSGSAERDSKKARYRGRVAGKLPASPIQRLLYREIGGLHRHHRHVVNTQIFHKLPGRLGFSLRNLVDESVLIEGHIFLGFSKNGQFVISYTFHLEADEHTAYPIYVYRLHWWHFVPYKRLKKVGEVRLFGEEDIQQELYIAVCEWPTISSRILIYGYCTPIDNEKHQCYITITSVPPVGPCEDCSQIAILHSRTGVTNTLSDAPPRCLNHAFTLHTKYELAPPYPSFAPKIFLKLDGVMVVNTGDSLIALSVDIEDNHSTFGFGLYSPRLARSVSNLSTTSSPYDDQMSSDSQDILSEPRPLEELDNAEPMLGIFGQNPCSNVLIRGGLIARDPHQSHADTRMHVKEKHVSTGKENLLSSPKHSMDAFSPKHTMDAFSPKHSIDTFSPKSSVDTFSPKHSIEATYRHEASSSKTYKSPYDVYNFDAGTPKKDETEPGDNCEWGETASCSQVKVRASLSFTGMQPSASMGNEETEIQLQEPDSLDSQTFDGDVCKPNRMDVFQKPADVVRTVGPREPLVPTNNTLGRVLPGLTLIPPENFGLSKTVAISPGCGAKLDGGSSTCSSCVSSPIILQSDSQCFTYSVRRYVEYFSGRDSPVEAEDDLNFAYHSVLPLEVHGANYSSMRLLTKHLTVPPMPCVVAKQLTLDIEHYLGETVKTTAEWGHRYLAFTDYDVQILEVCPGTCEVIAMVFVLIRARPPKDKHIHGRTMSRLYQTGFKLIWNLSTGSYSTLDVEDLTEVQHDALRKRWQPGHRICDSLQRRFAVPQMYCRSVHVLTNESVFKGQSLKMLLDRHHYVAILL